MTCNLQNWSRKLFKKVIVNKSMKNGNECAPNKQKKETFERYYSNSGYTSTINEAQCFVPVTWLQSQVLQTVLANHKLIWKNVVT